MSLAFEIRARAGSARSGVLRTPHGVIETPAFAPVGSLGAVKGVPAPLLAESGAQLMLANLYHLALRPGIETIAGLGGIHQFTGWRGPILTDSGGFQVFSLAKLRSLDDEGVTFRSHVDGEELRFTPERVVELQGSLGVDIAMVLDECPPWPVSWADAEQSLRRTLAWARRSRDSDASGVGGLFGIVQGSAFRDLRVRAAAELAEMAFDGYAIGGVSVGEPFEERRAVVEWTTPELPDASVRYLMGVGTPGDLVHAVAHGVDLFDCVLPSRNGRHGLLFTSEGPVRIKNAGYQADPQPLDPACSCLACAHTSRAFLHHLFRTKELTGPVLATLHNVRFYLDFVADLRKAIASGSLENRAAWAASRFPDGPSEQSSEPSVPDPLRS